MRHRARRVRAPRRDRLTPRRTERSPPGPAPRPSRRQFIGQEKVRAQLDLVLKAARARGATADHVL
ncbi:Holliday junction branch migration DNA helicase RuvB, partial [Streptomyces albidoflavus]